MGVAVASTAPIGDRRNNSGFGQLSINSAPLRWSMQDFESFEKVFYFFIRASLDQNYVKSIDENPELQTSLTDSIRDFHEMRQNLCRAILKHMKIPEPFQTFVNARGIVQYNQVPTCSQCIFSGKKLQPEQGTLIVVDGRHPFTFDKRFKTIVFYFWYIVHLPDELIINAMKWTKQKTWWQNGQFTYKNIGEQIQNHNNNVFAKQAYVKLTTVCKYIQREMTNIRINCQAPAIK